MEYVVHEILTICRFCLSAEQEASSTASSVMEDSITAEDIERFTGLWILDEEYQSYMICVDCQNKLQQFSAFRSFCLSNDEHFRELYAKHIATVSCGTSVASEASDPAVVKEEIACEQFECVSFNEPTNRTNLVENHFDAEIIMNACLKEEQYDQEIDGWTKVNSDPLQAESSSKQNVTTGSATLPSFSGTIGVDNHMEPIGGKNWTSNSVRERVIAAYVRGVSQTDISNKLRMKRSTVHSIVKRYRETGNIHALKRTLSNTKKLSDLQMHQINEWVSEDCTLTLKQLVSKVRVNFDISVSSSTIARIIDGFHYSLKKRNRATERGVLPVTPADIKVFAESFIVLRPDYADDAVIFVGVAGFQMWMRSSRGRTPVEDSTIIPSLRSRHVSIACALTRTKILHYKYRDSAFSPGSFVEFLEELHIHLEELDIGNCVMVMDDVGLHRDPQVKTMIEGKGHRLILLPPCSPWINPVETLFSKWQDLVKNSQAKSEEELMEAVAQGSALINRTDCEGCVRELWENVREFLNGESNIA